MPSATIEQLNLMSQLNPINIHKDNIATTNLSLPKIRVLSIYQNWEINQITNNTTMIDRDQPSETPVIIPPVSRRRFGRS
jgi:hypothetical protein